MLILSRAVNETVVIDGKIEITICPGTTSGKVKVGIEAPKDLTVVRKELIEKQRERIASTD